jgi:hypothetical protein
LSFWTNSSSDFPLISISSSSSLILSSGCCSLAQEMSFVTATCPISGSSLSPTHCWLFCLSSLCLLKVHGRSAPCPSPLLQCAYSSSIPRLCVLSSLFTVQFFLFCTGWGCGGQSAQGIMLVYPRGCRGNTA